MPQSAEQRKKWTPPAASAPPPAALPQIYVGGSDTLHPLKRDPMKRYGSYGDWDEMGKKKAFGGGPVTRST